MKRAANLANAALDGAKAALAGVFIGCAWFAGAVTLAWCVQELLFHC
jgi:hypothetical protein